MELKELNLDSILMGISELFTSYDFRTRPAIIMNSRLANHILRYFKEIDTSTMIETEFVLQDGTKVPTQMIVGSHQIFFTDEPPTADELEVPDDITPYKVLGLSIEYNDLIPDDMIGITDDKNVSQYDGFFGPELPYVRGDNNFDIDDFNKYVTGKGKFEYAESLYYHLTNEEKLRRFDSYEKS